MSEPGWAIEMLFISEALTFLLSFPSMQDIILT